MKLNIKAPKEWIGPYQVVRAMGFSDDFVYELWEKFPKLRDFFANIAEKIHEWRNERNTPNVEIEYHDIWCIPSTLKQFMPQLFLKLRDESCSLGLIDDEDVPAYYRSHLAPAKDEYCLDGNVENRYRWVLTEIAWAFSVGDITRGDLVCNYDSDEAIAFQKRKQNGLRLFAKYYETFWD